MRFSTYELLQLQLQLQSDVASVFHSVNTVEGGFEQLGGLQYRDVRVLLLTHRNVLYFN